MASKITRNYLPELFALAFHRSKPGMVTVNLTNRCNQRCIYCEIGKGIPSSREDILAYEDLAWIIDQMHDTGIRKISLCGGEPFLFERIFDVVAYAGKQNIRCSITTNGMTAHLMSDEQLHLLKKCKAEINISIDSFHENVQTTTRGVPAALTNALKSVIKLSGYDIPVTILTVISKYNYRHLSEFFATAHEMGIKQVLFQPVICYSNYPDRLPVDLKPQLNVEAGDLDALMKELKEILRFERSHDIRTNVYRIFPWIRQYLETAAEGSREMFFRKVLKKFYCREIDAIIDISYDGGIQPCGLSLSTVNIHKNSEQGLMALWSTATEAIRKDLQNERYYDYCNGCCHHFSRNMLASIMKNPLQNRSALMKLFPLLFLRSMSGIWKKMKG